MCKLKKIVIGIIICLHLSLSAQEKWTLNSCIEYALAHNLKLNDLAYNTASNKENYKQSYRELLPTVRVKSNYDIQYGRSTDPNTNQIVNSDFFFNNYLLNLLNAQIDLFKGFQKLNKIAATRFLYKATHEELQQEKYLLVFRVMNAFFDVQYAEELITISKGQVDLSESNHKFIKRQIELGVKAKADLYESKSVLISDQFIQIQNKNNLKAAKLKLIQEMNLENHIDITINPFENPLNDNDEKLFQFDSDSIYNKALTFIPIIKSEELKVKAAEKNIAVARGNLYPSFSLFAGYQTGYFETNIDTDGNVVPFRTQIKDNASQYIGFSLSIPISDRWSNRSNIKQQKISLLKANNSLRLQKQALNKVIQETVQLFKASLIEYKQSKQNQASAAIAFKIAQKKYEKGLVSILELNQAKNLYANAQNKNVQVKLKLKVQKKTLDFYKGIPVFNINDKE